MNTRRRVKKFLQGKKRKLLLRGDCTKLMKKLPDNSIDSVVTDPPYHLTSGKRGGSGEASVNPNSPAGRSMIGTGFMGKKWDGGDVAFRVNTWKQLLRVAKPGAYLLAFGGTRTYHKMASAIEEAGWEVRDSALNFISGDEKMKRLWSSLGKEQRSALAEVLNDQGMSGLLAWVYGCLSEDTEILTINGWKHYADVGIGDVVLGYTLSDGKLIWESVEETYTYEYSDTAYRIVSDVTDQIVSKNHRCIVEQEGKEVFLRSQDILQTQIRVPVLENLQSLQKAFPVYSKESAKDLLIRVQWCSSRQRVGEAGTLGKSGLDEEKSQICPKENDREEQSCLERRSDVLQDSRKLQGSEVRSLSPRVQIDGEKRWVCNGAQAEGRQNSGETPEEERSSTSQRPQSREQQDEKSHVVQEQPRSQALRGTRDTETTLARIEPFHYEGKVWCVRVPTGAFVARRNGKIFVTGNSGFPKSLNVSKAIDKKMGKKGKVIGVHPRQNYRKGAAGFRNRDDAVRGEVKGKILLTAPGSDEAREWGGWGSALKPAYEPIIIARKPFEGSLVGNVLKHGTGAMNIDECRIGSGEKVQSAAGCVGIGNSRKKSRHFYKKGTGASFHDKGRWPANVIIDGSEEVVRNFPHSKSGTGTVKRSSGSNKKGNQGSAFGSESRPAGTPMIAYGDAGSAARFFYCSKVSKSERNAGCDHLKQETAGEVTGGRKEGSKGLKSPRAGAGRGSGNKNSHPTVKPVALMRYLIKLVTRRGGVVLDPFMGSGSTGVAAISTKKKE